jgi:tellurite methyltransferase
MKYLILFLIFTVDAYAQNRAPLPASRFQQLTGLKESDDSKSMWDIRYSRDAFIFGKAPAKFLADNYFYIPAGGEVLDMGMGEGRNAVFMAQKGFQVTGIDISSVAVKKANLLAKEFNVKIKSVVASMNEYTIPEGSFDAILCFYYVDRSLISKMMKWLKPGGLLVFEAHTLKQRESFKKYQNEPVNYFLKSQELLSLFKDYQILKFEEPIYEKEFRSSIIVKK